MRLILVLLLFVPTTVLAQQPQRYGELSYRRLVDEITDADRSIIYTDEVMATVVRTGAVTGRAGRVVWRCDGAQIEVFLRADSLAPDSSVVRWRVDEHAPSGEEIWRRGASGLSVFAPTRSAGLLTTQAKTGHRLVVRLKEPSGVSYDYSFVLDGAEEAIGHLACDPAGHAETPTHGPQGTTSGMRGSYNANRVNEEQWVLAPEAYMPFLPH